MALHRKIQVEVVGLMRDPSFQVAKCIAEGLNQNMPRTFLEPAFHPMLECAWNEYLNNKKKEIRGDTWEYSSPLMCFVNGKLLGAEKEFISWAEHKWNFTFFRPPALYQALAEEFYSQQLKETKHTFVYMDLSIGGNDVGRLLFELFSDICPKTSKNFEALCTGEAGSTSDNINLSYKGSIFHRVVPNGWIQGGDIYKGKGDGGHSIYGPTFEDESFAVPHNKRGVLGMSNKGIHTNGSQFYITLQPAPWMDKRYVAFGELIEGTDVLKLLEDVPTYNERPKQECKVVDCGLFIP
ncbi:probable inactive peptidyl-prolyl cis-trans isomerase-like 6 [Erpetoichthys calabaricus]|uniref:Peptidyl-prolyl cis-trans isomerase n=1 Tax=Erpetoichthys calabaricus TaxID=27687 RepID=A0A8C4RES3_ERPCA|nr:probable inactive peptidyl-prolyl cis-trans isomerase-like 6 [Erpetoichthys calabaricus]